MFEPPPPPPPLKLGMVIVLRCPFRVFAKASPAISPSSLAYLPKSAPVSSHDADIALIMPSHEDLIAEPMPFLRVFQPFSICESERFAIPAKMSYTPLPNADIALPACENILTMALIALPTALKPSTIKRNACLALAHITLNCAAIEFTTTRTGRLLLYKLMNQLATSTKPLTTATSAFFAYMMACCLISSHPLLVRSKSALVALFKSSSVLIFSSNNSPYCPVFACASSSDVDISANPCTTSVERVLPALPNTAFITSPYS